MHAAFTANGIHGHDVLMPQIGGGSRLVSKSLQSSMIECRREWQDLQGNPTIQRNLLGFVNGSHSATTDLLQQAKVTQLPTDHFRRCRGRCPVFRSTGGP